MGISDTVNAMSPHVSELLEKVRAMPLSGRAELAALILATMDGDADADAEQAWSSELRARAERAIDGVTEGEDWESVHALALEEIGEAR